MSKTRGIAYIYCDEGVSPKSFNGLKEMLKASLPATTIIKTIDSASLRESNWETEAILLAFPGGRDIPYHNKLTGIGCKKIRDYVEKGGKYLGICAGAYFGCASFAFEKGLPLEVCAKRELSFYPGHAEGPALGCGKFSYDSERGTEAASIFCEKSKSIFHVYYNGGCTFLDTGHYPGIRTIATYNKLENRAAAIIDCPIGKGRAILSGVHIELSYLHISPQDLHLQTILHLLKEDENSRKSFCQAIINTIL